MSLLKLATSTVVLILLITSPGSSVDAGLTDSNCQGPTCMTSRTGRCSSCIAVNAAGTCEDTSFPTILCVGDRSDDTTTLPCLALGTGVEAVSKQCPADKPTKMCCGDQALSSSTSSTQSNSTFSSSMAQSISFTGNKETGAAAMTGVPWFAAAGAAGSALLVSLLL